METLVVVRQNNYWGAGKTHKEAFYNFRVASGKNPTNTAVYSEFEGSPEDLEKITIDDVDGTISYPKTVIKKCFYICLVIMIDY